MLRSVDVGRILRNLTVYTIGIALSVVGALGLAEAIEVAFALSIGLLIVGLAAVLFVHQFLGGPF